MTRHIFRPHFARSCGAALAILALAAACERGSQTPGDAPDSTADDAPGAAASSASESSSASGIAADVTITDGYGDASAGSAIRDIAFWSHPTLAFNSLIIAGGDDGVVAFGAENRAPLDGFIADNAPVTALDVAYRGEGADASALLSTADAKGRMRLFDIDNVTGAATERYTWSMTADMVTGLCTAIPAAIHDGATDEDPAGNGATFYTYVVFDGLLTRQTLVIRPDRIRPTGARTYPATPSPLVDCVVDPASQSVFGLAENGDIYRLVDERSLSLIGSANTDGAPVSFGLILKGDGAVLTTMGANGDVALNDADGHAMGRFRAKASFDIDGFDRVNALGAGFGNYGGVYSDGAIAIAGDNNAPRDNNDDGDNGGEKAQPAIRIVPWNSVMTALRQPVGTPVDPRTPQPVSIDAPGLEIELPRPE